MEGGKERRVFLRKCGGEPEASDSPKEACDKVTKKTGTKKGRVLGWVNERKKLLGGGGSGRHNH